MDNLYFVIGRADARFALTVPYRAEREDSMYKVFEWYLGLVEINKMYFNDLRLALAECNRRVDRVVYVVNNVTGETIKCSLDSVIYPDYDISFQNDEEYE